MERESSHRLLILAIIHALYICIGLSENVFLVLLTDNEGLISAHKLSESFQGLLIPASCY